MRMHTLAVHFLFSQKTFQRGKIVCITNQSNLLLLKVSRVESLALLDPKTVRIRVKSPQDRESNNPANGPSNLKCCALTYAN